MHILRRDLIPSSFFNQVVKATYFSFTRALHVGQPTPSTHPQLLKKGEITPGISSDEYIRRRKKLLQLLPENALAIIASAPVKMMTDVVPYTFRQDADYLYITGCQQPGGIAVLGHDCGLCMFMPEATHQDVMWQGEIAGVDAALGTFMADEAYPISAFNKILSRMIGGSSQLFHNVSTANSAYTNLDAFKKAAYNDKVKDFSVHSHEARWIKSEAEINLMRNSASVACQALLQTMLHSKSFPDEGKLSAKFEYECKMRGAQRMAFNPVVGGGPNGSVIHYARNDQRIQDGDLVLMDVGCELHGYVSDLTRTWPPCGQFSSVQEELYELILETNEECLRLCKPGTSIREINNHAVTKLQTGFKEVGILKSSTNQSFQLLNPTSIGHYLGMDVHDCTKISYSRPLEPGVVITIEPGVYTASNPDVLERYRGIGIRIEDDVVITESVDVCEKYAGKSKIPMSIDEKPQELVREELAEMNRRIADVLEPGETVLRGLRRLKGSSDKKQKMSAETKKLFDQLTEDAMKLMENGDYNVYDEKQENFAREAEGYEKLANTRKHGISAPEKSDDMFDIFGDDAGTAAENPSVSVQQSESDYVYDESSGYYYSSSLGYYYDPSSGLYCCATSGKWYSYNEESGTYDEVQQATTNVAETS